MNQISSVKKLESDEKMILCDLRDDLKQLLRKGGNVFFLLGEELELMQRVMTGEREKIKAHPDSNALLSIIHLIEQELI